MKETVASFVLIVLLVLILNPFHFWMPMPVHLTILAAIAVVFGAVAAFMFREHAHDERDAVHRMLAGRYAFLAGVAVLLVGIAIQSFEHAIDPWLIGVLTTMIVVKLTVHLYGDRHL